MSATVTLKNLSPSQLRELAPLVARYDFLAKPLGDFIPTVSPHYVTPEHLAPLLDILERVEDEPLRVLLSCPPRHSKSETLLHAAARFLARNPDKTVCYASHSQAFANTQSRKARQYAEAASVDIDKKSRSVREWRTTQGGGFIAVGVGAGLTGRGVDLLIIDDPIADREEAESVIRGGVLWDWFCGVAMTRLQPGASCIVLHTRWAGSDLIGRLLAERGDKWTYLNLPAINEDGAPLWPEVWPLEELANKRAEVGEWEFAALYMGQPRPRGSEVFTTPVFYQTPDLTDRKIVIGVDPAASAKTRADYSAAVVLGVGGYGAEMRAEVLEVWRGQVEIPELCKKLLELQKRWNAPLIVEDAGVGKAVPQLLRATEPNLRLHPVTPKGDKFQRAAPVALAVKEGRLRVPTSAPWLKDFTDEMSRFTECGGWA